MDEIEHSQNRAPDTVTEMNFYALPKTGRLV